MRLSTTAGVGLTTLLPALTSASNHGINCAGSSHCSTHNSWTNNQTPYAQQLFTHIERPPQDLLVGTDQLIACVHHVCAWVTMPCPEPGFPVESASIYAYRVQQLAGDLAFGHECSRCGNVALVWPDEVARDELTKEEIWCTGSLKFDYVEEADRVEYCGVDVQNGLCHNFQVEVEKAKKAEVEDGKKRLERKKKVHEKKMKKLKEKAMKEAKEELMEEYEAKMKAEEEAKDNQQNDEMENEIETRSTTEAEKGEAIETGLCSVYECDSAGSLLEVETSPEIHDSTNIDNIEAPISNPDAVEDGVCSVHKCHSDGHIGMTNRPEVHSPDSIEARGFFHDTKKDFDDFKEKAHKTKEQVKEAGKAVGKMGADIALQKAKEAIEKLDKKIQNEDRSLPPLSPRSSHHWIFSPGSPMPPYSVLGWAKAVQSPAGDLAWLCCEYGIYPEDFLHPYDRNHNFDGGETVCEQDDRPEVCRCGPGANLMFCESAGGGKARRGTDEMGRMGRLAELEDAREGEGRQYDWRKGGIGP